MRSGEIKALVILKENAMHLGMSVEQLAQLPALIMMNILPNEATKNASVVLPACGFAEKRGSMVNGKGRLQRLNRAIRPPGNARDDWEILRDLLQAIGGGDSLHSIEDVFRRISETVPQFAGLSLSKIGDLGVHILENGRIAADPSQRRRSNRASDRDPGKTPRCSLTVGSCTSSSRFVDDSTSRITSGASAKLTATMDYFFIITSLLKISEFFLW